MKKFYFILFILSLFSLEAQVEIVNSEVNMTFQPLKTANGLYFTGSNADIGIEPYFFDGTDVVNLKDINLGTSNSWANGFFEYQGKIYFNAINTANNSELYITDGTESGTILFKEINLSPTDGSYPSDFIILNNDLIFTARENGANAELFTSDGTETGTTLLKEILPGSQYGSNPSLKTLFNGLVYFNASNGGGASNNGFELWVTDGTNSGTNLFYDINPGNSSSYPQSLHVHNGLLFFQADDGVNGLELWVTDGTTSGTFMFADINPGASDGLIAETKFYSVQDKMFFEANDGTNGRELWVYDSNTNSVQMVADINSSGDSFPNGFMELNGNLFFSATDGINGAELFKLDLITNQVSIFDINPTGSSFATIGALLNNRIYFAADDGTNGRELWVTNGTVTGTAMVADLEPGSASSFPDYLTAFNGELIFSTTNSIYKFNDAVLGLNNIENDGFRIKLYPNPTSSYFQINSKTEIVSIEVFDTLGKQVKVFNKNQNHYDISLLGSGLYILKIKTLEGVISKKLMISE
ncbi:ELWxxDGT repeat protein [Psychroserpens sp. XS_ASV72]|uniref:ELWxxDGT repeat protein n=1 Tax=Psychroserpens sp. XS_ASV72 TaxID=3241293 RepID=UPI0035184083